MRFLVHPLMPLTVLLLTACGVSTPSPSNFIPQDPPKPIETNLREATLWCNESSQCPENVGYIVSIGKNEDGRTGVSQCTGFLVSSTIVATNSHCIPDEVKNENADCGASLGIKFPEANGRKEEIHLCDRLLHASQIADDHKQEGYLQKPDYAFFSLKQPSKRPVFEFLRSGIDDGTSVTIYSVDPMSEYSLQGRLMKRSCTSYKGGEFFPKDLHAFTDVAVMFGENCDVHGGNSGSPAIGPEGKVIGFVHGGLREGVSLDDLVSYELRESSMQKPAIVTNAACLPSAPFLPSFGEPNLSCSVAAKEKLEATKKSEKELKFQVEVIKDLEAAYANWLRSTTAVFVFKSQMKLTSSGEFRQAILTPMIHCLKPKEQWGASSLDSLLYTDVSESIIGGATKETVHSRFKVPSFKIERVFDPQFRFKPRISEFSSVQREVKFKPALVKEVETEVGTDRIVTGIFGNVEVPLRLRHCTAAELQAPPALSIVEE